LSETNIFTDPATTAPVNPVTSPATNVLPPEVADLVGTGKKYATAEAALASIPHAQKHILTLEEENRLIKAELEKRKTAEELLGELKQSGFQSVATTTKSEITSENIAQLVNQTIEQKELQKKAEQNTQKVISVFTEKFGNKAEEIFKQVAQESGLSISSLNSLAATSPNAVLKLAGLEGKENSFINKPKGTVNTDTLTPTNSDNQLSSRVKPGASTKDVVNAWKIAGQKVGRTYN